MATLKVKLLPHQLEFVKDIRHRFLALCAGYGAGKTRALIYKTIDLAGLNAGTAMGLFSATHELSSDILVPEMDLRLDELKIRHSFKGSPHPRYVLKFPHGETEVLVKSFENWKRIIAHNYSCACVDEIDTVDLAIAQKAWNKLLGRIRVGKVCQIATTSTPEGFRFMYKTWIKERVDDKGNTRTDRRIIHAKSTDNPFLDPAFIPSLLENYPPELVEAYVNGQFVNMTGGVIYSTFDRRLNDCDDRVEHGDRLHIGMDFNVGNMSAVVHIFSEGHPRAVGELVDILDTPAMIREIKYRYSGHRITVYPDATGDSRDTSDASTSDLQLLASAGFEIISDDSNPRVKNRINSMKAAFCNAVGDRRYRVNVKACPRYTESLEQQIWKDGKPDKSQGFDHLNDAGGYFIVKVMPISGQQQGQIVERSREPIPARAIFSQGKSNPFR